MNMKLNGLVGIRTRSLLVANQTLYQVELQAQYESIL